MYNLQENVKKILEARKVQKRRINQTQHEDILRKEDVTKKSKDIVDTLKLGIQSQKQDSQQAQQQQEQQAQRMIEELRKSGVDNQRMLSNVLKIQQALQPPEEDDPQETEESDKWIQHLYRTHRHQKNPSSNFEIELKDGKIGLNGRININKLFNQNSVSLKVGGKTVYQIPSNEMSKGLAALLLLPFNDIQEAKIPIRSEDAVKYLKIMDWSGFRPGASKKYAELLKNFKKRKSSEGEVEKTGSGVFAYNSPSMLDERLYLLAGSVRAGNTSKEIKGEMRSIVDEMFRIQKITPKMHKMLYQKFMLM